MNTRTIIKNLDSLIDEAYLVATKREFGKNVRRVYYVGGTLFLDILDSKRNIYFVLCNISTEIACATQINNSEEFRGLISLASLKKMYEIYYKTKGVTEYSDKCFEKSCLRHLYTNSLEKHSTILA